VINSQRKKQILEFLSGVDFRTVEEIAQKFNVSTNTVRRDINELAEANYVRKFYGGISLVRKFDSTYDHRALSNLSEKEKIAEYAATLIKDNDLIFIDSGSTTSLLLDYINRSYNLTIATNNLHVIEKATEVKNWDLIVIGSHLKHSSHSFINVQNWDYLNSLNFNKAFIATTGLTIKSGATNPDNAEALIKTNMMKRSSESYLLVDSSKFDQTSLVTFASINDFYMIITSGSIPQYYLDYFAENNIQFKIT
jgi:DeoR family myo-inositol catabolism operon transcriptional repressor